MKSKTLITLMAGLTASVGLSQEINPVWVQHHNGLVNVAPADKLPTLQRRLSTTGNEAYGPIVSGNRDDFGRLTIKGFANFLKYDDDHYLLGIRENGIDEQTETDPVLVAAAAAYPDKSIIWVDAHTGKPLGVALQVPQFPVENATQNTSDFYWKWGINEGVHGQRVIYTTFRYKVLRWASAGTVAAAGFPAGKAIWSDVPTEAWIEPVPGEPNPTYPPLDKFIPSVNYLGADAGVYWNVQPGLEAPTGPDDPNYAKYIGSSGGDGSGSWRWKAFRVSGSGNTTKLWAGGGTWRQSQHEREFLTDDGGLTFYPVSRLNDRGDGWGAKGNYTLGGQPSQIRTEPDGRKWCIQGHFPGTGWGARPSRYTLNPAADNDIGRDNDTGYDANDAGAKHKERKHFYDPDGRAVASLPAFNWEAAGKDGLPLVRPTDGVDRYDGNWGMTADTKDGLDYIVSYSIPSWNQQFGGADNPASTFTPGWLGLHTLDGKIAPGAKNAWKLPCYETDERIIDPNGNGGTGFDYGYDGDVQIYPDTTAPAGSGKALVLAAFGEYGFGVFQVQNVAAQGTIVGPAPVTTLENRVLTVSAVFQGTGSPLLYKWQKDDGTGNFVDVPGAKGNLSTYGSSDYKGSYTVKLAKVSDSGKYRMIVLNPAGNLTSNPATVLVNPDNEPPVVVATSSVDGDGVDVCFDELLDPGDLNDIVADPGTARDHVNYSITTPAGAEVTAATLRADGKSVHLTVTGLSGVSFTLKVVNVRDYTRREANKIPAVPGQIASGQVQGFTLLDIGNPTAVQGATYSCNTGEYEVEAGGVDIWGNADQFHFAYKEVVGDFDVKVQVAELRGPGNRNGIMLRESLDPDSRHAYITWNPGNIVGAHVRPETGAATTWFNPENNWVPAGPPPNVWLRLKRSGEVISAFRSSDGLGWTAFGTTTVAIPETAFLGLATAANGGATPGYTRYSGYSDNKALSIGVENGVITLSWSGGGVLQSSSAVTGSYTDAAKQANPQTVTAAGSKNFYRLR